VAQTPTKAIPARPADAPPIFVTIGRTAPKKATIVTLLAFAQVQRNLPDARLEIVGADLDAPTYQTLRALKIENHVAFLGAMSHGKVLETLSRARCYVHPSVTAPDGDMEGTPVSVLEAMAAGLPVVSTRHGGILDVLDGTGGGVLVDEYDVTATADAMLMYGRDAKKAGTDGAAARRALASRWSMDQSISRLAQLVGAAASRDVSTIARFASG
jgi:colanic acid/amylovoran biosynthesis glycosyltransferase